MKRLKVGIIGCGGIANGKHLPSLKALDRVDVVAFCDLIKERAESTAKKFGTDDARIYTDYKELLKEELDAVYVLTPNRSHSFISVDALYSGKNVMCEKPMAINYEEGKKMVDAARKTGKLLTVGYQHRQRPDSQYLKEEEEKGTFGDIYFARAQALRRRGVPTWGVFINEYEQGGGPLIDIGTHALDLALWLMNNYKPKYVAGKTFSKLRNQTRTANSGGDWDISKFTVEDSAFGFVVMENGALIILETSWAMNIEGTMEAQITLCGDKAGADMNDGLRINGVKNDCMYIEKPTLSRKKIDFYGNDESNASIKEQIVFLNAVEGKGDLVVTGEQALVVTRILDAIYESEKTGKPVFFE